MSRKIKRGFKAPKNYDPHRGKKAKKKERGFNTQEGRSPKKAHRGQGHHKPALRAESSTRGASRGEVVRINGEFFIESPVGSGNYRRVSDAAVVEKFEGGKRRNKSLRADRADFGDYGGRGERTARGGRDGRADRFGHNDRFERGTQPAAGQRFRVDRDAQQFSAPKSGRASSRYERESGARVQFFGDDAVPAGRSHKREKSAGFNRGERRDAFVPPADVVLERLEAKQTSSQDVAGLTFADLGLGEKLVAALKDMGAEQPFAIQAATIPDVLSGQDVLGRGRTGSGKTIAFGASLVERLLHLKKEGLFDNDPQPPKRVRGKRTEFIRGRAPKALIMAPTRELALQIDRTVQPLARAVGFFTTQVVGGAPIDRQIGALRRGVDIVIGTPGRVEDLIERGELNIRQVHLAVLDEADHMAELGFIEPVQRIWRGIAPKAQKLLFSATLDAQVTKLVNEFLVEPSVHEVADQQQGNIEHNVLVVLREEKLDVLTQLLAAEEGSAIVFTRTRAYAETLREMCEDAGIRAVDLHGNLNQAKRERNLKRFSDGKARVLVATDVAARGIHVDDVALVVQADPPDDYKSYLHRAGRTGRAGSDGVVVTVIPRNRQKRTRQLFENAGLEPAYFGDFQPGDAQPWQERDFTFEAVI